MKKIFYILISTLLFSSCSDSFLQTENKNTLDVSSFFKTETDLKLAVNAAYTPLAQGGMFGLRYFWLLNTFDPDIYFEGLKGYDIFNFDTSDANIFMNYGDLYYGLFRTSDILANIDRVKDVVDPTAFNRYKAQVKALRGMYYFYLVTLYNTPIYYDETNVPTNPLAGLSNGTPEQFWNKLEEDLKFAAENLPESWGADDLGRITKGAAYAQLGKALLYKHYHYYLRFNKVDTPEEKANLVNAKAALKSVIDSHTYQLILPKLKTKADYQAALLSDFSYVDIPAGNNSYLSENNLESVWEVQYNDNPGTNTYLPAWTSGGNQLYQYFSLMTDAGSYMNQVISPNLWNEFESVSGHPGGYSKDPRAYATCYLDGDSLDWRASSGYKKLFQSTDYPKYAMYTSIYSTFQLSKFIGLKKYYYPQLPKNKMASSPNNVRVIRYADVLLMYAEVCYQIDADADGSGLAALNEVRSRVDMPAVSTLTPKAIKHERRVELATEGHYFNDIIRWSFDPNFGINLSTIFNNSFSYPKNLYFPIPQSEINSNRGMLKQNPGW